MASGGGIGPNVTRIIKEGLKPKVPRKRIGELLVESGVLTQANVDDALRVQQEKGGKLVEILMALGYLEPLTFAKFLSNQRGIPSLELANYQVPEDILIVITAEFARAKQVFPIDKMGTLLTLGMECPLDTDTIEKLESMTGLSVKPILCSQEDIRSAIEQYYPLEKEETTPVPAPKKSANTAGGDGSTSDSAKEPSPSAEKFETAIKIKNVILLIREIDALPTLPQTVQRVKDAADDENSSLKDIADIVESDPPIAAKLLQLANSVSYGFPNKIDDIGRATALLGPKETFMVVVSSAILDLTERSTTFDHQKYWQDSIFCAGLAKSIATVHDASIASPAFMAGLLHDIGRFALAETVPVQYAAINPALIGDALVTAERQAFLIAHPEAGYFLASRWGLPPEIATAIRFHHNPELAGDDLKMVTLVALSATLTECRSEYESDTELPGRSQEFIETLQIDTENVARLYAESIAAE